MIACAGTVTFFAFTLFFVLALVLMRAGLAGHAPARPPARHAPPYDWQDPANRSGLA